MNIPVGWKAVDSMGWIITNGIDEMRWEIGFGYVML